MTDAPISLTSDRQRAQEWAISVVTSAHYDLEEYPTLLHDIPVGGISALAAMAACAMTEYGITQGLSPDQAIMGFALAISGAECPDEG